MRHKRTRKYRRHYKKMVILTKFTVIWYTTFLTLSTFSFETNALFIDQVEFKQNFKSGTWENETSSTTTEESTTKNE